MMSNGKDFGDNILLSLTYLAPFKGKFSSGVTEL